MTISPDNGITVQILSRKTDAENYAMEMRVRGKVVRREFPALEHLLQGHEQTVNDLKGAGTPNGGDIRSLGQLLFEELFKQREGEPDWLSILKDANHITLDLRPPELADLPWEAMYDPLRDLWVATRNPLVRRCMDPWPIPPVDVVRGLRVLLVGAWSSQELNEKAGRPENLSDAVASAVKEMQKQLREASDAIECDAIANATRQDLSDILLRRRYHVLVLLGHGTPGKIWLNDQSMGAVDFAKTLSLVGAPHLVALAACKTGKAQTVDNGLKLASFAHVLAKKAAIPAILAMQYEIGTQALVTLLGKLFTVLAAFASSPTLSFDQMHVGQALARARSFLLTSSSDKEIASRNAIAPALYLQSLSGVLFRRGRDPATENQALRIAVHAMRALPADKTLALRLATLGVHTTWDEESYITDFASFAALDTLQHTTPDGQRGSLTIEDRPLDSPQASARSSSKRGFNAAVFSPDGSQIATANLAGRVSIWNVSDGALQRSFDHPQEVRGVCFSRDGGRIATGCADGYARIWDVTNNQKPLWQILHSRETQPPAKVQFVAFHPLDSRCVVTTGFDRCARVWDAEADRCLFEWPHNNNVMAAAFSLDGKRVVTASWDYKAYVWSLDLEQPLSILDEQQPLLILKGHKRGLFTAAFSPDGRFIATGGYDREVYFWDAETGKPLECWPEAHTDTIRQIAFHPSTERAEMLTASWDGTVKVWDLNTNKTILTLGPHAGRIYSAMYHPHDGSKVLTASADGTAVVWPALKSELESELVTLLGDRLQQLKIKPGFKAEEMRRFGLLNPQPVEHYA